MTPPDTAQPDLFTDLPASISPLKVAFDAWKERYKVWTHFWPDADPEELESPWIAVNGEYIKPGDIPNRDGGIFVQPPSGTHICDSEEEACTMLCRINGWVHWLDPIINPAGKPVN
jgi:hypothetical protein